jgi:orotidine-5'-phosphate decarboxylase
MANKTIKPNFYSKLENKWREDKFVCVGLDSEYSKIPKSVNGDDPEDRILEFNKSIIDKTHDLVLAYKLNSAFYEAQGEDGIEALVDTVKYINKKHPDIPVILDAKRADIGNTNNGYVDFAFKKVGVDAITIHPYLGQEAVQPFLDEGDKGIIVLVRTSNPGASEFQDIKNENGEPLYIAVAKNVTKKWNKNNNCAVVVGATYPNELKEIREIIGDMPILIPGVGAQGGDVVETIKAGLNSKGEGIIINSSRAIIFADNSKDFADVAREKTLELHNQIINARKSILRENEVKNILGKVNAVLTDGHFVYVSGKHGDKYVNKDAIYPNIDAIRKLAKMWAEDFRDSGVEVVVGPAMGGILLSHDTAGELSKLLNTDIPGVYAEKNGDGGFAFTRGYDAFVKGKKVLIVEDVLTTGGSVKKVIDLTREAGGDIVGLGVIANRGGVKPEDVGVKEINALINIQMTAMEADECTLCKTGVPVNTNVGKRLFKAFPKSSLSIENCKL